MYIILSEYESVWPVVWPKNKCRSLWPIFDGQVIVPYTLKTISSMNIIIWDNESVWHNAWPQNKCRSPWPVFTSPVILSWRLFDDPTFDLKINVGHCDLYFMVQWLCLLPWKLFHAGTSLFGIMNQYDPTHDRKINLGHSDLYFNCRLPTVRLNECISLIPRKEKKVRSVWFRYSVVPLPVNKRARKRTRFTG